MQKEQKISLAVVQTHTEANSSVANLCSAVIVLKVTSALAASPEGPAVPLRGMCS